jgi:hypothetical protein
MNRKRALYISNVNLGGDPAPGVLKRFTVDYEQDGNHKQRSMDEFGVLDFSWDITSIRWGQETRDVDGSTKFPADKNFESKYYVDKPEVWKFLFWNLDMDDEFEPHIEQLGGDPAYGLFKTVTIKYERTIGMQRIERKPITIHYSVSGQEGKNIRFGEKVVPGEEGKNTGFTQGGFQPEGENN